MRKINKKMTSVLLRFGLFGSGLWLSVAPSPMASATHPQPPYEKAASAATSRLPQPDNAWLDQAGQGEMVLTESRPDTGERGAHLALLLPCYEQEQQLLFTQLGAQRIDRRTVLTLGIGQRWFTASPGYWGYNFFYDHQLKDNHQRLGSGLEYRRNAIDLALNGYLPLTPYRLIDHAAGKARPAHGFDLRLYYTPEQAPYWRFSLIGEHYFGYQLPVDKQRPKRHPSTITFGFDLTPLPLVTVGYGFKLMTRDVRNHQLQLTLRYHLGVPLAKQLDPQQVAVKQTLAGGGFDLIQRNAQMVLQWQPEDEQVTDEKPEDGLGKAEQIAKEAVLNQPWYQHEIFKDPKFVSFNLDSEILNQMDIELNNDPNAIKSTDKNIRYTQKLKLALMKFITITSSENPSEEARNNAYEHLKRRINRMRDAPYYKTELNKKK